MPRNVSYKVAARGCMNNCTLSGYLWLCKHGLCDFMWVIVEVDDADGSFAQTLAPVIQLISQREDTLKKTS